MQRQIAVKRIHHVSLISALPTRTARFYIDLLGLLPIDESIDDGEPAGQRISIGDESGTLMTITKVADGPEGELGIGSIHHVALTVASFDALLKWKRWLQQNEILVYGPYDQQAYQDLIFTDPDGVLLELATQEPGWAATQNGEEVYSPPKESMAPYRDEHSIRVQTWPHPVPQIEPDMVLQGIHHVSTIVSSLDETNRFYRDVLGMPLVRKCQDHDDPEVEHWYWGLEGGRPGTVVTGFPIVHVSEGGKPIYGRGGIGVVDRLALEVGEDDRADQSADTAVVSPGPQVTSPPVMGTPLVSLRSPDGLVVDLVPARADEGDTAPLTAALPATPRRQGSVSSEVSPPSPRENRPQRD